MKQVFLALVAGILFGAGLGVSGMSDPFRVQSFLDLFGQWDPTLAFVMGGAILPMILAWIWRRRLEKPFADERFDLPSTSKIDRNLVLGAVLFGAGWGIGGLCPGPALADLSFAPAPAGLFVIAMLGGMAVHRFTTR
jgi:uncharacterized membrane protein YedE/YeeE